jgi:hypothetical protein
VIRRLKILKAAAFVPDADDNADTVGTNGADDVTSYGKKSLSREEVSGKRFMIYVKGN